MISETGEFSILWGDLSLMVPVKAIDDYRQGKPLAGKPWDAIREQIPGLESFFFAHQVHEANGHLVTTDLVAKNAPWTLAGDYLITHTPGVGIGVLTADCLPIVIYDPASHSCAVVHAGWRSSVAGIVGNSINHMIEAFGSCQSDLKLYFGPCAGACCYEVAGQLVNALGIDAPKVTQERAGKTFFDLASYNKLQAIKAGIRADAIDMTACCCTICTPRFCSYRRERERAGRQISLVCLSE